MHVTSHTVIIPRLLGILLFVSAHDLSSLPFFRVLAKENDIIIPLFTSSPEEAKKARGNRSKSKREQD